MEEFSLAGKLGAEIKARAPDLLPPEERQRIDDESWTLYATQVLRKIATDMPGLNDAQTTVEFRGRIPAVLQMLRDAM